MRRREFTTALSLASAGVLAGCLGNDDTADGNGGGTDTPDSTQTDTPESEDGTETDEDQTEQAETPTGDETVVATVRAFFDAYRAADAERINEQLHPEGPDEIDQEQADSLADVEFTIESTELTEREDGRAAVELRFSEDSAARVKALGKIRLRRADGEWKVYGFERSRPRPRSPTASFDVEHGDGSVTIVHQSGESISATQLFVRGEGLAETGSWASLGGETDDNGDVAAGLSVTVETTSSTVSLQVVWESADGEATATLLSAGLASESASDGAPEAVTEYLADTDNFQGVVDRTDEAELTVIVGAGDDGLAYAPPAVRVTTGTTVTWEWTGEGGAHSVTAEDESFGSEVVPEEGHTLEHTFDEPGTTLYYCLPHRAVGMKGAVVVE